jgi:hypothetical protein
MVVQILSVDAKVPVEKEEKLLLHQVDLGDREAEALVTAHSGVPGPVLFLGEESLRFLAAKIKAARNMRWVVHFMPLATGGKRARSRLR